jgi:hypothetical protein
MRNYGAGKNSRALLVTGLGAPICWDFIFLFYEARYNNGSS